MSESRTPGSVERMSTSSKSGGGAGGIITIVLVLGCIGLLITCLVLWSGKKALADSITTIETKAKEDVAAAQAQVTAKERDVMSMRAILDKSIPLSRLPAELQARDVNDAVQKIAMMVQQPKPVTPVGPTPGGGGNPPSVGADSPAAWLENVSKAVAAKSINTKEPTNNDPAKVAMHRGIQVVMARIGAFSKPVTGNAQDTYDAVVTFQKANGLTVDGIIGKGTWGKVREKFEAMPRTN